MKIPDKLVAGDKIGLISTARKISRLDINYAVNIFKSWGLEVVYGDNLFNSYNQFSGTDEQRANDLQFMINDKSIKAIFCVRGGYGTARIIDKIDFMRLQNKPKWIIGYSDITVLHSHLNNFGIATLHSSMPINFENNTLSSIESIHNCLFSKPNEIIIKPHVLNRLGKTSGQVVGGNLSILYSLLGSRSDLDTNGKILFIEDLDEYLYHIDRMLLNLKRNKKLKNIKALIVGGMTDLHDNEIPFGRSYEQIVLDYFGNLRIPICFSFPSGHLDDNRAIKLGCNADLEVTEKEVVFFQK